MGEAGASLIPRFRPDLGARELVAALVPGGAHVEDFEREFASRFESGSAIAFPYGRSALKTVLAALDVHDADVLVPAYTCSVVAHAIVLSGNRPQFVDIRLHDFNTDLDVIARAINSRTKVIVATHLFGYPLDVERLRRIAADGEARFGHRIFIVQDCAHAFGARWHGRLVCKGGDCAIFGLNVSKTMTAIFGGVVTTDDAGIAVNVRDARQRHYHAAGAAKRLRRTMYLAAATAAFSAPGYAITHWLENSTPLLNGLTKAYHRDERVAFPPDAGELMSAVEARVGLVQLERHDSFIGRRREHAAFYDRHLDVPRWVKPPLVDGATYSHYVVRVPDRERVMRESARAGVELGEVIQYSVPDTAAYRAIAASQTFPNALAASRQVINVPVHPSLSAAARQRVVDVLGEVASRSPEGLAA